MSFLKLIFIPILILSITTTAAYSEPVSQVDTSGWHTYHNASMGFEVRYPDTWHVKLSTGTSEGVSLDQVPQVGKQNVSIQFFIQRNINPKGLAIHQWHKEQLKEKVIPPTYISVDTNIGGQSAVRTEHIGSFGKLFQFFVCLNKADIFTIGIIQPPLDMGNLDPEYEAILSTFKFID